jgi:hypothetical protein
MPSEGIDDLQIRGFPGIRNDRDIDVAAGKPTIEHPGHRVHEIRRRKKIGIINNDSLRISCRRRPAGTFQAVQHDRMDTLAGPGLATVLGPVAASFQGFCIFAPERNIFQVIEFCCGIDFDRIAFSK